MSAALLARLGQPWRLVGGFIALALAGGLNALSLAWPTNGQPLWWLQIAALMPLYIALQRATSTRRAFAAALVFVTAWLAGTFWWLFISMHTYGGLSAILALLAVLALAAALGLWYALACALYHRLCVAGGRSAMAQTRVQTTVPAMPGAAALVFALLWLGAEMARGTWLTGFGWGAIGYAHIDGPLAAFAPLLGVYGISAIAALLAALLATIVQLVLLRRVPELAYVSLRVSMRVPVRLAVAGIAVLLGAVVLQHTQSWSQPAGSLSVTLLQGNIPQDEKFEFGSGVEVSLEWYAQQMGLARTQLVLAPETAIPLLPDDLPRGYMTALSGLVQEGNTAVVTGIPLGNELHGYTNSAIAMRHGVIENWQYDKHHLVPFGEFVPPYFKWFTEMMNIPLGDFNRGSLTQAPFAWQGQRVGVHICYEDLFGEELGLRFAHEDQAPTLFANISNIGWFGDSLAIDQHLHISRMRALEFERAFLRATNTGATVIIDHRGHVTAEQPRLSRGALVGSVEGRVGTTPYAWWVAHYGLLPLWGMVILGIGVGLGVGVGRGFLLRRRTAPV